MNINVRLKEFYPIGLLIILLMAQGLAGSTNPSNAIAPLKWSNPKSHKPNDSCKDVSWLFNSELSCSLYVNNQHQQ